jgi:hypothetical protein
MVSAFLTPHRGLLEFPHLELDQAAVKLLKNTFSKRMKQLNDKRRTGQLTGQLLSALMKAGLKWAGSSLIRFLSTNYSGLIAFLNEMDTDGTLSHDIDVYRTSRTDFRLDKNTFMNLGLADGWVCVQNTKANAVDKLIIHYKQECVFHIDQVNLTASKFPLGTDLWANLFCSVDEKDEFNYGVFHEATDVNPFIPSADVSMNNVINHGGNPLQCYVLRQNVMPMYSEGKFIDDGDVADPDRKFRRKVKLSMHLPLLYSNYIPSVCICVHCLRSL